jgi:hypothetical protein
MTMIVGPWRFGYTSVTGRGYYISKSIGWNNGPRWAVTALRPLPHG